MERFTQPKLGFCLDWININTGLSQLDLFWLTSPLIWLGFLGIPLNKDIVIGKIYSAQTGIFVWIELTSTHWIGSTGLILININMIGIRSQFSMFMSIFTGFSLLLNLSQLLFGILSFIIYIINFVHRYSLFFVKRFTRPKVDFFLVWINITFIIGILSYVSIW